MHKSSGWLHKIRWLVWLPILFVYIGMGWQFTGWYSAISASYMVIAQIFIVYTNNKILVPRFYRKRDKRYMGLVILIIAIGVAFSIFASSITYTIIDYSPNSKAPSVFYPIFMLTVINGLTYAFSMSFTLMNFEAEGRKKIEQLHRENIETELKFLKSQINPHFLFNALNNIYSISYTGEKEASEKILQLSDMLRYVLQDCKEDFVPLKKELDYINNYIDFQTLKTDKKQNIIFNYSGVEMQRRISPMILISFVENSFKHSKIEKDEEAFIHINLSQERNKLQYRVENSIPDVPPSEHLQSGDEIGLVNVKKRLELVYPGSHLLKIKEKDSIFSVILNIEIPEDGEI